MVTRDLVLATVFVILVVVAATAMRVVRKGSSFAVAALLQKDRSHPLIPFTRPRVAVAGGIRFIYREPHKSGLHIRRRIRKSAPEMFPPDRLSRMILRNEMRWSQIYWTLVGRGILLNTRQGASVATPLVLL